MRRLSKKSKTYSTSWKKMEESKQEVQLSSVSQEKDLLAQKYQEVVDKVKGELSTLIQANDGLITSLQPFMDQFQGKSEKEAIAAVVKMMMNPKELKRLSASFKEPLATHFPVIQEKVEKWKPIFEKEWKN